MNFSLLSTVIICLTAAMIYAEIKKGYKHGLSRSLIDLATLIFCAFFSSVISFLIAMPIGNLTVMILENAGVAELLENELLILLPVIKLLINMLVSLLLYLPVFFILRLLVLWLIKVVYRLAARKKNTNSRGDAQYFSEDSPFHVKKDKPIGAAIGIVSGLLLSIVVFMPLTGLLKSADDALELITELTGDATVKEIDGINLIEKYSDDVMVTSIYACGGETLYNLTARTSVKGHSTNLNKEISILREFNLTKRMNDLEGTGVLSPNNMNVLENLLNDSKKSLSLKLLMAEFIKGASTKWLEREAYFGINRPAIGNYRVIDDFLDSVLYVCSTTTVETYEADLNTILNLVALINEYSALFTSSDYQAFMTEFIEGNALLRIETELNKNPHMKNLTFELDSLFMNVLAEELISSSYADDARALLYKDIAAALSETQALSSSVKITALSNSITESLENYGVYLPNQLASRVATLISNDIATAGNNITAEDIENYFSQFISSGLIE